MLLKGDPPGCPGNGCPGSVFETALAYLRDGWSVIPLSGKCPTVPWRAFQQTPAGEAQLRAWHQAGLLQNLGVVCGAVSQHLVVLDIDQEAGYAAFQAAFPALTDTYTVRTGSGHGYHLYWVVEHMPPTLRIHSSSLGNLELLSQGCQVVAPPSLHPQTGRPYAVARALPLVMRTRLDDVRHWLSHLRQADFVHMPPSRPTSPSSAQFLRPDCLPALLAYFERGGYRKRGDWLNGPCVFPRGHQHGDVHPSFGFNSQSGYGHCFVCGTFTPEMLCDALNLIF